MNSSNSRHLPINQIIRGDAVTVLQGLPDECVDTVITSPPYWGLRSYNTEHRIWGGPNRCQHEWRLDLKICQSERGENARTEVFDRSVQSKGTKSSTCRKCNAWRGELGLEPYFFQYVEHLCSVFDEVKRVLKPTGTLWVNMGDTYGNGKGATPKSLCQIPNRFAIEMAQRGWILRNEIIWHKPNAMPSSVKDRFTVDFEKVFFFSKSGTYYFETQFEPMESNLHDIKRMSTGRKAYKGKWSGDSKQLNMPQSWDGRRIQSAFVAGGTLGRNKRTVWRISTRAFPEAHFAVFPQELVETPVKASCPEFVCTKCAKPREKIYESVDVGRVQSDTKYKTKIDNAGRL